MHILFVTQWFEPEPAFKGATFAAALRARGHEVEVATAFPNYPGGKLYTGYRLRPYQRDNIEGLRVHRLAIWPSHDRSPIGRIANYLSFFLSTLIFGLLRAGRYDLIYVYHPPITPAAAAALYCALHRLPLVVEIQDLWPESVGASGMAGGRVTRILGGICNFVYRRAVMVIAQSSSMMEQLRERGVPADKLRRIYNWATYRRPDSQSDARLPQAVEASFQHRFNVVYGGNLGQAQALGDLIDAVAQVGADSPEVHLHLFGHGIERPALAAQAAHSGHVTLHGRVGRQEMDRIFDRADLLILQLKDDPLYAVTIPSKVQHYLACGRPIVAGLSGEAAGLLKRSGAAIVCPPQDVDAIASAIRRVFAMSTTERNAFGKRGRCFYENNLGFERAIEETIDVISEAAARHLARRRSLSKGTVE